MTASVQLVMNAKHPEDVFGDVPTSADDARHQIAATYRCLAKDLHPDHGGSAEAFARLGELYRAAQEAVAAGRYGERGSMTGTILVRTRRHGYRVSALLSKGKAVNIYRATYDTGDGDGPQQALLSIARDPRDGKLLSHEAKVLKAMLTAGPEMYDLISKYLPAYIEAFGFRQGRVTRQGIAFREVPGLFSLRDVRDAYPLGVDPKDSAWMLRRLLMALGMAHALGYAHQQVTLDHVLIQPEEHGLVLVDWSHAVPAGEVPEDDRRAVRGRDVAAACHLAEAITNMASAPPRLAAFLSGCQRVKPSALPDALALKDEYDALIEELWGPRRFRPFSMVGAAA